MDRLHGKRFHTGPIGKRNCKELAGKRDSEALSLETAWEKDPEIELQGDWERKGQEESGVVI